MNPLFTSATTKPSVAEQTSSGVKKKSKAAVIELSIDFDELPADGMLTGQCMVTFWQVSLPLVIMAAPIVC